MGNADTTEKCRDCTVLTHWNGTTWSDVTGPDPDQAVLPGDRGLPVGPGRFIQSDAGVAVYGPLP